MQKTISIQENKLMTHLLEVFHFAEQKRHTNLKGPKIWCNFQRFVTLFLFKRSGKSLRRFVNEFHESRWPQWLQFAELPAKSTIHDWYMQSDMRKIQRVYQRMLRNPQIMAVDGTGVDSWHRSRHYERRIGDPMMPYAKLDILIDTETQLILDHVLRVKPRHDTIAAAQMFKRTKFKSKCLADKGYDSEPLHELARENEIELLAPVRGWKKVRGFYRKKCAKGIEQYSTRNTVESAIHALKSVYAPVLRSKLHWMKKKEMSLAIFVYNVEKMIARNIIKVMLIFIQQLLFRTHPNIHNLFKWMRIPDFLWKAQYQVSDEGEELKQ